MGTPYNDPDHQQRVEGVRRNLNDKHQRIGKQDKSHVHQTHERRMPRRICRRNRNSEDTHSDKEGVNGSSRIRGTRTPPPGWESLTANRHRMTETEPSKSQLNTAGNTEDSSLNTRQYLAEACAHPWRINAFNALLRTKQQRMAQDFLQLDLLVPQYEEPSEDKREKEYRPPKRLSMVGRPRTTGNTRHRAIREDRTNKLKTLRSPIQFTTRIGHKNTREMGPSSALTSIAHTTEIWEQLPFFKKGASNPSQQFNPSQYATQGLQLKYQQSPDHTENKGTQNGSAKMRNLTQESNGKSEQLEAADETGKEGNIPP
ncbi:hypothetical protein BDD12DRAFT_884890 [Trichophaea hybrida]|nr:hypothetical protein BDD12DRAFT_884890 [Trichophaea hybrida]